MNDLISVVITTYNRPWNVLERALDSVLRQTYRTLEVIIVNDSPDNQVLRKEIEENLKLKQDNRIRYACMKVNKGACRARNVGIKLSKGSYVAFLDDDDEWFENKLERQYALIKDRPDVGIVYCRFREYKKNKVVGDIRHNVEKDTLHQMLRDNQIGSTSFPLVRKESLVECGGFNPSLKAFQDWDMWLRILEKYQVVFCNEVLGRYNLGDDGISANIKKRIQGWNHILKNHWHEYQTYPDALYEVVKCVITNCRTYHKPVLGLAYMPLLLYAKIKMKNNK